MPNSSVISLTDYEIKFCSLIIVENYRFITVLITVHHATPLLTQMYSVHILTTCSFKNHFNIIL